MIPPDIEKLLASVEFEDSGWLQIQSHQILAGDLTRDVKLGFDDPDLPSRTWRILCKDVRTYCIRNESTDTLESVSEHPVLLPFLASHVQLSFQGHPTDPLALIGDLYLAHQRTTQGWLALEDYLNSLLDVETLLASGNGIIAEGPKPLLEAYASVLRAHECTYSFIAERPPRRWLGGQWQDEPLALKALLCGTSYVVAPTFAHVAA